jgi:adenylate cyclase
VEDSPANRREWSLAQRHGLFLVGVSPVIANLVGSVFNILYNQQQIWPILTEAQRTRFDQCWLFYNTAVYPIAVACWIAPFLWLRPIHRQLLAGHPVDEAKLVTARRSVINLPWWILIVASMGWLTCIPVFPLALAAVPGEVSFNVVMHLTASFATASLIAVNHSFFAVELLSQRLLYPVFFRNSSPATVPGAFPLNIMAHGMMFVLSAAVSPVVSLVLLLLVPNATREAPIFGIAVGVVAITFAFTTAWMLGQLVVGPVRELKDAAMKVGEGDYSVRVNLLRADEFGPLIERFNKMVEGLRNRELLQETFGRHVGQVAAEQILAQGEGQVGSEQIITVIFVDIRNFTEHSSQHSPQEVVTALNIFFRSAVETIESHGGMVNKFLGDGFMALFGIGAQQADHARRAVTAAQELFRGVASVSSEMEKAGWPGLRIGVGINTGPAIVGSVGSPKRMEYTAIGDTVNVASRVEALTKTVGHDLLITEPTWACLPPDINTEPLAHQTIKGKGEPLAVFAITVR